ncbi:membrane-bound lytic murein transglycosylase MltF [Glaciecola petra]|uniref:Membrane-bound lytic murein transglycosylase F n=1 Tax=Glaciecola petra TaxID=3075602 RepID=A0ABU2ZM60_9ALTE|nr:membrane-bound lytic murein transglycosylase MltF [Aestuariibacter sp. P117]MDT0593716.1 membrane-bound lytic murein transglycosylase MltF [Aestuariibacter sp. P117]
MSLSLRSALVFVICAMLTSCKPYSNETKLSRIIEDGVLKVGSIYGRTTFYNGAEEQEGFEFELAQGFAEFLDVKLEVYPYYSYAELIEQLDGNRVDLLAANITMTNGRKAAYKFGPAYQSLNFELVYQKGQDRPRSFEELEGNLTIIANDLYREPLQSKLENDGAISWQETNEKDIEELLEMVANGELDYTIADSNILDVARRRFANLGIGFSITDTLQIAWMLNKTTDDSLRAAMLEYFGEMQSSGQLAVLEDKYFGHVRTFDFVDTRAFVRSVEQKLPQFKEMFQAHAGDIDWRLLAAMAYQESHWNPDAISPTGVRGMMMLTRGTAKDLGVTVRTDPEQSISGGSRYFASLLRRIPARIKEPDRVWMAMAAYNIGLGHLEDTRRITERLGYNPDLWIDVKKHLPLLRQKRYYEFTRFGYARGDEAVNYVDNIRRYYDSLLWLDENQSESILPELIESEAVSSQAQQTPNLNEQ